MSTIEGPPLRLGTRSSALALAQSGQVARALEAAHPGLSVELVPLVTRGDRYRGDLAAVGGKGLFTEELEAGLSDGSIDLAVHSLKDLPVHLPPQLVVAAYPRRADPRDVLIAAGLGPGRGLDGLAPGASVLTGALRRRAQLLLARPDLEVRPVRGNVDTRLGKWRRGDGDALILAAAGLERLGLGRLGLASLGLAELPRRDLDPEDMLPAPGQGTLALETRRGSRAEELCRALDDPATARAAAAERAVVAAFGGDCTLPLAAWAREERGRLQLTALLATPDGHRAARGEAFGASIETRREAEPGQGAGETPETVARRCVEAMYHAGAGEILELLGRPAAGPGPRPS